MKFVADTATLRAALQLAGRTAERRGTIPMLTHARIEARQDHVLVTATDLDRAVTIRLKATVSEPGVTTANARAMVDFVGTAADGSQIEVEMAKERLVLRVDRARLTLMTLPADDFPVLQDEATDAVFTVAGSRLAAALAVVAHAQSNEETRFYLRGTYLHRRGARELVLVATDGHRLAREVMLFDEDLPDDLPAVILPSESGETIRALIEKMDEVEIAVGPTRVRVTAGDTVFVTKLIDGTFPDYERVIPAADIAEGFETGCLALTLATRRCVRICTENSHAMKLAPGKGTLQLFAGNADNGEIADEIEAQATTKIPVGINGAYLAQALDALGGQTVRVRYVNDGSPIAFTDPANQNRLQIVMAMRV